MILTKITTRNKRMYSFFQIIFIISNLNLIFASPLTIQDNAYENLNNRNQKEIDDFIYGLNNDSDNLLINTNNITEHNQDNDYENKIKKNQKEINDYIYGLNYDSHNLLIYTNNITEHNVTSSNVSKELKFKNKISVFKINSNNAWKLFPGSLLLANKRFVNGDPDVLISKRSLMNYRVELLCLRDEGNFKLKPTYTDFRPKLSNLIWNTIQFAKRKFYDYNEYDINNCVEADTYPYVSLKTLLVDSKDQVIAKFGYDISDILENFHIAFQSIKNKKIITFLNEYKINFFTTIVESPEKPSDVFDPSVTLEELTLKNVNNLNPPLLVKSVTYGRIIYVKFEAVYTDELSNLIFENNEMNPLQLNYVFQATVYVVGGNNEVDVTFINSTDKNEIKNKIDLILSKYKKFSPHHLSIPISYTAVYLKDHSTTYVNQELNY